MKARRAARKPAGFPQAGYGVIRFTGENLLVINTKTGAPLAFEQIVQGPASGTTAQSILPYQPGETWG